MLRDEPTKGVEDAMLDVFVRQVGVSLENADMLIGLISDCSDVLMESRLTVKEDPRISLSVSS